MTAASPLASRNARPPRTASRVIADPLSRAGRSRGRPRRSHRSLPISGTAAADGRAWSADRCQRAVPPQTQTAAAAPTVRPARDAGRPRIAPAPAAAGEPLDLFRDSKADVRGARSGAGGLIRGALRIRQQFQRFMVNPLLSAARARLIVRSAPQFDVRVRVASVEP